MQLIPRIRWNISTLYPVEISAQIKEPARQITDTVHHHAPDDIVRQRPVSNERLQLTTLN